MIASFDRPEDSKSLYFKLNNSFHLLDPLCSPTYKIAGVYALFKDSVCYYVGQSKNLPSRLSTHLTGKYESIDEVKIYFIDDYGFSDFYQRTKDSQKQILENNENYLINKLKPIENIMVPSCDIDKKGIFTTITDNPNDFHPDLFVNMNKAAITVHNGHYNCIEEINDSVLNYYVDEMVNIAFHMRGLPS